MRGGGKDKMRIESKDLWQSAYVLAKSGELEDVRVDGTVARARWPSSS
ncbi:hypothetical protein LR003_01695 [candidate division NPL-UPA2 bacterium]|nr:hypothetical protein [candidate division NPL-UPA2 bacterium]